MKRLSLALMTAAVGALLAVPALRGQEPAGGERKAKAAGGGDRAPAAEVQEALPTAPPKVQGEKAGGRLGRLKAKLDRNKDGKIGPEEARAARNAVRERLAARGKAGGGVEPGKAQADGKGRRKAPAPAKAHKHRGQAAKPAGKKPLRAAQADKKALRIAKAALRTAKIALRKAEAAAKGPGKNLGKRSKVKARLPGKHLPAMGQGGERRPGQMLRARFQNLRKAHRGFAGRLPARQTPMPRRALV
ncbi:MAG: hypothetical protein HY812_03005 [Planctomycetes bacterium]|nr:hypothetical protein [Planctomycetota bacterium]